MITSKSLKLYKCRRLLLMADLRLTLHSVSLFHTDTLALDGFLFLPGESSVTAQPLSPQPHLVTVRAPLL